MSKLCKLAEKYICDKCPKYHHYYTEEYHNILKDKKYNKMLEIGIGTKELMTAYTNDNYQEGASLYMWKEYFENCKVYGCDIKNIKLNNIETFVVDQSNEQQLENMMNNIGNCDFIIDDGSHILSHQIISFLTLWKYTNDIYIIEDVYQQHFNILSQLENEVPNCKCIKTYIHEKDIQGFVCFKRI